MASKARRTPTMINSKYFLKEILAVSNDRNRAWQKKQLESIMRKIRDNSVGCAGYSGIDRLEDVKCAWEGIISDGDIYNDFIG
jgi:hypothetical protein